ncbi:hypothetical protein PC120_g17952 [Phytophthora cactorum]|nr:hypothetical protein PC120_g17952 [Phytophthora cactorum]
MPCPRRDPARTLSPRQERPAAASSEASSCPPSDEILAVIRNTSVAASTAATRTMHSSAGVSGACMEIIANGKNFRAFPAAPVRILLLATDGRRDRIAHKADNGLPLEDEAESWALWALLGSPVIQPLDAVWGGSASSMSKPSSLVKSMPSHARLSGCVRRLESRAKNGVS